MARQAPLLTPRRIAVCVGAVVVLGALLIWHCQSGGPPPVLAGDAFFSGDDGKTFFIDSSERIPPFQHKGTDAVGARVFVGAPGGKPFVGYLERFSPAGQARAEELQAERAAGKGQPGADPVLMANMELKRPGEAEWIKASDPRAVAIRKVMSPDDPKRPAMPMSPTSVH